MFEPTRRASADWLPKIGGDDTRKEMNDKPKAAVPKLGVMLKYVPTLVSCVYVVMTSCAPQSCCAASHIPLPCTST